MNLNLTSVENKLTSCNTSKNIIEVKSTSKINFGLWIKEKRNDGYHEIETIFYENNDLFDIVKIEKTDSSLISVNFLQEEFNKSIPQENNLAYKAAALFFEKLGVSLNCKITIDKKIPTEAGLGGGSSNAAAVLKGLNKLFDNKLRTSELIQIAKKLGSDVPFLVVGGTCIGKGKGDELETITNNLQLDIKVIKPENISISTQWAYEEIDLKNKKDNYKIMFNLFKGIRYSDYDLFFKNIFNDFEEVVFEKYPQLLEIKNQLLKEGYETVGLCGSGSAVYGVRKKG